MSFNFKTIDLLIMALYQQLRLSNLGSIYWPSNINRNHSKYCHFIHETCRVLGDCWDCLSHNAHNKLPLTQATPMPNIVCSKQLRPLDSMAHKWWPQAQSPIQEEVRTAWWLLTVYLSCLFFLSFIVSFYGLRSHKIYISSQYL